MQAKTLKNIQEVIELYNKGQNNKQIANSLGKAESTISRLVKMAGLENKIAKTWSTNNIYKEKYYNDLVRQIKEDAQKGLTRKQSAKRLNIHHEQLNQIAKKEHIHFCKVSNAKYDVASGIDNFLLRLQEYNKKYEYIDGYVNDDSKVRLRCKDCGDIITRYANAVRKPATFRCYNCERITRANRQEQKKEQRLFEKEKKNIDKQLDSIQLSFLVCKHCGKLFIPIGNRTTFCSNRCASRNHEQQKSRKRLEKAKQNGTIDYTITLDKLIKRDNNICYLCGKECNLYDYTMVNNNKIAGNYYPSIEHVIPITNGGTHTWDNVKLAHRICNSLKSDKNIF